QPGIVDHQWLQIVAQYAGLFAALARAGGLRAFARLHLAARNLPREVVDEEPILAHEQHAAVPNGDHADAGAEGDDVVVLAESAEIGVRVPDLEKQVPVRDLCRAEANLSHGSPPESVARLPRERRSRVGASRKAIARLRAN